MKRGASIRSLFEGRGSGGPTVTIHLPEKLAQELFAAIEESLGMSGDDMGDMDFDDDDGDDDDEGGDDDDLGFELPFGDEGDDDGGDDDEPDFGGDDDEGDDDEDDNGPPKRGPGRPPIHDSYGYEEEGADFADAGGMMDRSPNDQELDDDLQVGGPEMDEKHLGFKKLAGMLSHEPGVHDPNALAASIGMKKYHTKNLRGIPSGKKH